jgi:hypothetical protein
MGKIKGLLASLGTSTMVALGSAGESRATIPYLCESSWGDYHSESSARNERYDQFNLYTIKVKKGDSIFKIHEEFGLHPRDWILTVGMNQHFRFFKDNFDPNKDLKAGQKIVLPLSQINAEFHQRRHRDREVRLYGRE